MPAPIGIEAVNYLDIARRLDKDGGIAYIIEMLDKEIPLVHDLKLLECNDGTAHKTTIRTSLPKGIYRRYNEGIPRSKSTTEQFTATCSNLEVRSGVDKKLVQHYLDNISAFRWSEDKAFVEGLSEQQEESLWYGNEVTNPAQFTGLTPIFNSLSDGSPQSKQIINAGGTTANAQTSIWFVSFGTDGVHGIYPKGSIGGLTSKDLGEIDLYDENNNPYRGYATMYDWDLGLVVRDPRYVTRIANVDLTKLAQEPTYGNSIVDMMMKAWLRLKRSARRDCIIYCREEVLFYFNQQQLWKGNACFGLPNIQSEYNTTFWGRPIKQADKLLLTEAVVA